MKEPMEAKEGSESLELESWVILMCLMWVPVTKHGSSGAGVIGDFNMPDVGAGN